MIDGRWRPTLPLAPVALMAAIVVASNILVQFPLAGRIGGVALGDLLTWGAFTYPFAFLVTDLTNRRFGPRIARRAVYAGFLAAIVSSVVVPPLLHWAGLLEFAAEGQRLVRIAVASGLAFLAAQLLDVWIFSRLRRLGWWQPPAVSSVVSSVVDTAVFFTLAFSAAALALGPGDMFAAETAPFLGAFAAGTPRWSSWAVADLGVKLLIAAVALVPYRMLMTRLAVWTPAPAA